MFLSATRIALICSAIILPLALTHVSADSTETVDTAPVSGYYIDPSTNLVSYYDAALDVLTPTGNVGNIADYEYSDAYQCPLQPQGVICVDMRAMFTGYHCYTVKVRGVDSETSAIDQDYSHGPYCGTVLVSYLVFQGTYDFRWTPGGHLKACLFSDGIQLTCARTTY